MTLRLGLVARMAVLGAVMAVVGFCGGETTAQAARPASGDTCPAVIPGGAADSAIADELLMRACRGDYLISYSGMALFLTALAKPPQTGWQAKRKWDATLQWKFEVVKRYSTGGIESSSYSVTGKFTLITPDNPSLGCSGPISMMKSVALSILGNMSIYYKSSNTRTVAFGSLPGNVVNKCAFLPNLGWTTKQTIAEWSALASPPPLTLKCRHPSGEVSISGPVTGWPETSTVGIGKTTVVVNSTVKYELYGGCTPE